MTAPNKPPHIQPGPVELKDPEHWRALLDKYSTYLFDMDGVIWTGPAGDQLTPNIGEALAYLRSLNKRIAFITNNATRSRQSYVDKFKGFNIPVSIDEIYTCGSATANYVKEVVLPGIEDESKRGIYLIGQKSMEEELREEGLEWSGGTDPEDDVLLDPQDFSSILPDPSIGIVIYAFQMRINYKQLAKAYNYLSSNPGCQLILTNDDQSFLLPHGGYAPGEGAIASVLFGALPKGRKPTIVGKPYQPLLDVVHREMHFDPSTTIFIGDRLETDVLFAKRGGVDSILVWTGISKPSGLVGLPSHEEPEYTMSHVGALLGARQGQANGTSGGEAPRRTEEGEHGEREEPVGRGVTGLRRRPSGDEGR
ncbi:hypothetical protein JCM8097_002463 [Rhodosporidiobolus ruineniae]